MTDSQLLVNVACNFPYRTNIGIPIVMNANFAGSTKQRSAVTQLSRYDGQGVWAVHDRVRDPGSIPARCPHLFFKSVC